MKLYTVSRAGNTREGPDGDDTVFLVRARDVEEAALLVETELREHLGDTKGVARCVIEIGVDTITREGGEPPSARVLLGPSYQPHYREPHQRSFVREYPEYDWVDGNVRHAEDERQE